MHHLLWNCCAIALPYNIGIYLPSGLEWGPTRVINPGKLFVANSKLLHPIFRMPHNPQNLHFISGFGCGNQNQDLYCVLIKVQGFTPLLQIQLRLSTQDTVYLVVIVWNQIGK